MNSVRGNFKVNGNVYTSYQHCKVQYIKSDGQYRSRFQQQADISIEPPCLMASLICHSEYPGSHFNCLSPPTSPDPQGHLNLGHPSCLLCMQRRRLGNGQSMTKRLDRLQRLSKLESIFGLYANGDVTSCDASPT